MKLPLPCFTKEMVMVFHVGYKTFVLFAGFHLIISKNSNLCFFNSDFLLASLAVIEDSFIEYQF